MDEKQIQANRRFFHAEPTFIPVSDCYDYVIYPNGLMANFKDQRSAGNEKILLYFLARHMTQETPEGETTDFKDVAQAFWGKHDYISERTGLLPSRISEAIKSLVDAGILVHKVERGVGQFMAFSESVTQAWSEYSQEQALQRIARTSGKRKQAVPVTGSGQFRSPEVGSSGKRKQAVPVTGSGSYIEDPGIGFRESDPVTDPVDGWRGDPQPANKSRYSEIVGIAQEIEAIFEQRSRYIDWATINLFLAGLVDSAGGDMEEARRFSQWAKEFVRTNHGSKGLVWKDWKMDELGKRYQQSTAH